MVFCDDLDGWDGEGGREVQEEGDICTHIADTWELNTILPNEQNGQNKVSRKILE